MTKRNPSLKDIKPGQQCVIVALNSRGPLKRRMVDMGLTPGTSVFVRKKAPWGDPVQVSLRGYELTLRGTDADAIEVEVSAL